MFKGYKIAALCAAKIYEDQWRDLIEGLNNALNEYGWRLFVYATDGDLYFHTRSDKGEASVFELINYNITDAVLVVDNSLYDEEVKDKIYLNCREHDIPTFSVDSRREGSISIRFDYEAGFESVVRHVIEHHGVKDIHMIAGLKDSEFSEVRIDTVRRVASECGVPFDDSRISYGDFWSMPAIAATEKIIESGHIPEAVICANDVMAISVCETLNKHGIRIPEDVIVTGFDGIKEIQFNSPKITSSKCDFIKLGYLAGRTVVRCGADGHTDDAVLKPEVVVSESCGCCDVTSIDAAKRMMTLNNMYYRYQDEYRHLQSIAAGSSGSDTVDMLEERLRNDLFYNMMCVLNSECLDPSVDPLKNVVHDTYGKDLRILYDHRTSYIGKDRSFNTDDVAPDIDGILYCGFPAVFTAINSIDVPLGFLCFYYTDIDKTNYLKMGQIRSCINSSVSAFRDMHYQHFLQKRIEDMYKYDDLTGLYNRKGFDMEFERIMKAPHGELTFVICDLDGLKYINDTFGHTEGDNAIYRVSQALAEACGNGICSKYGGDELIGLIQGRVDEEKIRSMIHENLARYNDTSDRPYKVSASVGAYNSDGNEKFSKMFSEADMRMYSEKSAKKRGVPCDVR